LNFINLRKAKNEVDEKKILERIEKDRKEELELEVI
jgi:hypothetical protein